MSGDAFITKLNTICEVDNVSLFVMGSDGHAKLTTVRDSAELQRELYEYVLGAEPDKKTIWEQTDNYPIQFCPHCGEKIEISVVEEIDVSDKYNELTKQREELWKKCQRTDSKKKESELRKQVRKLDDQINDFYELGEWKGEY